MFIKTCVNKETTFVAKLLSDPASLISRPGRQKSVTFEAECCHGVTRWVSWSRSLTNLHHVQHQPLLELSVLTQGTASASPTNIAPPLHVPLQKMGAEDDPEAFIELFERTVGKRISGRDG